MKALWWFIKGDTRNLGVQTIAQVVICGFLKGGAVTAGCFGLLRRDFRV